MAMIRVDQLALSEQSMQLDEVPEPVAQMWLDTHYEDERRPPFRSLKLCLQPGASTTPHHHHDTEMWLILRGVGEVMDNGQWCSVNAGDIVQFDPLDTHSIRNTSTDKALTMVAIWWQNMPHLQAAHGRKNVPAKAAQTLLLIPHDSSVHIRLAADIWQRARRLDPKAKTVELVVSELKPAEPQVQRWFDLLCDRGWVAYDQAQPQRGCRLRLIGVQERLADLLTGVEQGCVIGSAARAALAQQLTAGWPDLRLSHQGSRGVAIPGGAYQGQILHPAFAHAIAYASVAQHSTALLLVPTLLGQGPGQSEQLLLALLMAMDQPLPKAVIGANPLQAQGLDLAVGEVEQLPDALRFYLAWSWPEADTATCSQAGLQRFVDDVLEGQWRGWLRTLQHRLDAHFSGQVPDAGPWSAEAHSLYAEIVALHGQAIAAYREETPSPARLCQALLRLLSVARRFGHAAVTEQQKASRELDTHVALELMALRSLALFSLPIVPAFASTLLKRLGETQRSWHSAPNLLPPGHLLSGLAELTFDGCSSQ